jgi:hypothetical protein
MRLRQGHGSSEAGGRALHGAHLSLCGFCHRARRIGAGKPCCHAARRVRAFRRSCGPTGVLAPGQTTTRIADPPMSERVRGWPV